MEDIALYNHLRTRTWVEISRSNLRHNLRVVREHLPAGTQMLAVVKADAYGHGASFVAAEAAWGGASYFAVASLKEAENLRISGIRQPILILSRTPWEEIESLLTNNITQTVSTYEEAEAFSRIIEKIHSPKKLSVHVKIDTGMARLGFSARDEDLEESLDAIEKLSKLPGLAIEGIFTHFASADSDQEYLQLQFERFQRIIDRLEQRGVRFLYHHCANSIAALTHPEMCLDMARIGIVIYGYTDHYDKAHRWDLRPVMNFYARISLIRSLGEGEHVGYGCTFTTNRPSRIAVIEVGYADGLLRSLSNRGYVKLYGKKAPIVGRVCMDRTMIDVTDIPEAKLDDVVCIFGGEGENYISADDQAACAETISYELFCDLNKRVPKIYVD